MGSSFNSSGVISTSEISESLINVLDSNFYCEPDNSVWIRISHQNNPTTNKFASTDTFTSSVKKSEDVWFNVALCNLVSTWELMIIQAATSDGAAVKYRWIQIVNPMTATFKILSASSKFSIETLIYYVMMETAMTGGVILAAGQHTKVVFQDMTKQLSQQDI